MDHPAVDVTLGGAFDGVDLDEIGARTVRWDSEYAEIGLADGWYARKPVVEFGEE